MWRNWQTRMIQVHVGNHAGSSPVIRTTKTHAKGAYKTPSRVSFSMQKCPILGRFCVSYPFRAI